jgi:hypothetical protein
MPRLFILSHLAFKVASAKYELIRREPIKDVAVRKSYGQALFRSAIIGADKF